MIKDGRSCEKVRRNKSEKMKAHWADAEARARHLASFANRTWPFSREMAEKYAAICTAYKTGRTLQDIGNEYGLTRERVRQIVSKAGLTKYDGGQHVALKRRRAGL